jgi:hypothetical protein
LIPGCLNQKPAITRQLCGQFIRIADAHEIEPRITAKHPRNPGDGDRDRFEVARRQGDQQTMVRPGGDAIEPMGDGIEMPIQKEVENQSTTGSARPSPRA